MSYNKILYIAIIVTGILAISSELASILYALYFHLGKGLPPELTQKFFPPIDFTQDIWLSCIGLIAWCAIPLTLKIYNPHHKNISPYQMPWRFLLLTVGGKVAGIASIIQCVNIFLLHIPYISDLCAWYIYGEFSRATWLICQGKTAQQTQYILHKEIWTITGVSIIATLGETWPGINIIATALLPNIYTWAGKAYRNHHTQ